MAPSSDPRPFMAPSRSNSKLSQGFCRAPYVRLQSDRRWAALKGKCASITYPFTCSIFNQTVAAVSTDGNRDQGALSNARGLEPHGCVTDRRQGQDTVTVEERDKTMPDGQRERDGK